MHYHELKNGASPPKIGSSGVPMGGIARQSYMPPYTSS